MLGISLIYITLPAIFTGDNICICILPDDYFYPGGGGGRGVYMNYYYSPVFNVVGINSLAY